MSCVGIILALILTSVCFSSCDYSGKSFKLYRNKYDKFENPIATLRKSCKWDEPTIKKFCYSVTKSRCDGNCCSCTCDYTISTFDRKSMTCRRNQEIRLECKTMFVNYYQPARRIELLDFTKKGEAEIYWSTGNFGDKVNSFNIEGISWHHDGNKINKHFLTTKGQPIKSESKWRMTIKWDKVPTIYYGEIFRVNTSYRIERKVWGNKYHTMHKNDCFVFKSSGSITVTFPSKTTSPPTILPTTSLITFTPPKVVATPRRATKPTRKTTRKPANREPPYITKDFSTGIDSSTTKINPEARETQEPQSPIKVSTSKPVIEPSRYEPSVVAKKGDDWGDNTFVISSVVVVCVVFLVAVGLVVFLARSRSTRGSRNKETAIANRNDDNPMMMSLFEGNYAVPDNSVNYSGKNDKSCDVCDYAEGHLEDNYTCLDKSKIEPKPPYQSLIRAHGQVIPVKNEPRTSSRKPPKEESFHHGMGRTERTQDPDTIYQSVDETAEPGYYNTQNPAMLGRIGNEGVVCGTLENKSEAVVPEHFGREIPGRTCYDNPESFNSVLEDDNVDYLSVLDDEAPYEQPLNPPVPDV